MELLTVGASYQGTVRNVAPFGLFIELVQGQKDGLLRFDNSPYSEIAKLARVPDILEVIVTSIDHDQEAVYVQLLPDATRYEGFWANRNTGKPSEESVGGTNR